MAILHTARYIGEVHASEKGLKYKKTLYNSQFFGGFILKEYFIFLVGEVSPSQKLTISSCPCR